MRTSGILLPISSLPSPGGIGTMGAAAREFVDFLHAAGQHYWQILPVCPTSYGDSPYQSFSTFAGNPYFIDLDQLAEAGLLTPEEYRTIEELCPTALGRANATAVQLRSLSHRNRFAEANALGLESLRECGITVLAMTGPAPNPLAAAADDAVCIDSPWTATVQECHLVALHLICAAFDAAVRAEPARVPPTRLGVAQ